MRYVMNIGVLFIVALVLYWIGGGWLVLAAGVAVWIWASQRVEEGKKLKADPATKKGKSTAEPTAKLPDRKPAFVPTPEHLAQIEQARQSSLATLQAQGRARRAQAKAARKLAAKSPALAPEPALDPVELPDRVEFSYRRSDGMTSHRTVVVNKVDALGGKFTGFCEMSGSVRTFKASSVQGLVTRHETGEIVPVMYWFQALQPSNKARARL